MKEDKKVTIYDVAAEAGLSIATVSRYINKKGTVAAKSEEKITAAIEKLGYHPDTAAQKLATGQSNTVGLLVDDGAQIDEYYQEFLSGVYKSLSEEHIDVMLTSYDKDPVKAIRKVRLEKKVDGLICPFIHSEENAKKLLDENIPFVYTGKRLAFDTEGHNVYGGFSDYRKKGVELFIEKGCKKLLVVDISRRDSDRSRAGLAEYEDRIKQYIHTCTDKKNYHAEKCSSR